MQHIHLRLNELERNMSGWNPLPLEISETKLIALSDHLRRTYLTVASLGECDAVAVSNLTSRCRALESNYLNQLCRMGWLNKRKVSKSTYFCLAQEMPKKKALEQTSRQAVPLRYVERSSSKYSLSPDIRGVGSN